MKISKRTAQRVGRTLALAAACGAATAVGSGIINLTIWWITHH